MHIRELFDDFPLNGQAVVPIALQQLMNEPLDVTSDWSRAEQLLQKAIQLLPGQLEVKVALYKMYAYSNQFESSLALIQQVLKEAAEKEGFPSDWHLLNTNSACWNPARGALRLYLYSLKASGFVFLRMGEIDKAIAVLDKLAELDVQDQVGGSVVRDMAERLLEDDC
jgi:tetratricopeptide (TPR) repeat protein